MKRNTLKLLAALVCAAAVGGVAQAITLGTDDASASAYNDGWQNGDDGSITGAAAFGSWALASGGGSAGHFIGDSTSLSGGNSGGNINVSGESFGLYGHSGLQASAERSLEGDLGVGQTFSIQIAVNYRNGFKGFAMKDGGSEIFTLNIGGDAYTVSNAATGNGDLFSNNYSANTVFTISLTQTSGSGGNWEVARTGGLTGTATGTYSGTPDLARLYIGNTTGGGAAEDNLYANNLSVVPEPSTIGLLLLSGTGMLALFRRRNS